MVKVVFTKKRENAFGFLKFLAFWVKEFHELNSCYLLNHNFKVFLNDKSSAFYLELQLGNFHCHHCNGRSFIINGHAVVLGKME